VLPSHQENFGIAVAEALACGKPVLLSDKVNIAAEIAKAGAGLMELDTPTGTARLLKRWIEMSVEQRQAMTANALLCFNTRYDMRENAKLVVRLFETLPRPLRPTATTSGSSSNSQADTPVHVVK
jgi:glycosyltransferase involved in cell wall biosynthesis